MKRSEVTQVGEVAKEGEVTKKGEVIKRSEVVEKTKAEVEATSTYTPQKSSTPEKAFPAPTFSFQEPNTYTWRRRSYRQHPKTRMPKTETRMVYDKVTNEWEKKTGMVQNDVTKEWEHRTVLIPVLIQEPWDDKFTSCRFCHKRNCNIRNREEVARTLHFCEG